jgi:hypothetical protein
MALTGQRKKTNRFLRKCKKYLMTPQKLTFQEVRNNLLKKEIFFVN